MTLCRICDRREATDTMPFSRRPCCAGCRVAVVKEIDRLRLLKPREYLNLKETMRRHPAGKGPRYVYRYHYNDHDLRID